MKQAPEEGNVHVQKCDQRDEREGNVKAPFPLLYSSKGEAYTYSRAPVATPRTASHKESPNVQVDGLDKLVLKGAL